MTLRRLKTGYFVLEGLNSFATTYFLYYLFFYLKDRFGYGNAENLWVSALNGLVYMASAWFGGRFAQRAGPFAALRLGFTVMSVSMFVGFFQTTTTGILVVMVVWTLGLCFTWPTLEALASERETRAGLQSMVGVYNLVWAAAGAVAYFVGGALLDRLGMQSLFWLPCGVHVAQIALLEWLRGQSARAVLPEVPPETATPHPPAPTGARHKLSPQTFLKMAWIANPFAYVAINTVAAVIPGIAAKMQLSLAQAGIFCSLWLFARLAAFILLWLWPGWHYRFGWLAGSYAGLIGSFLAILLLSNLWTVVLAQIVFGFVVGLCYYSSLYYSMDIGEAQSEHGGLHETAIGFGVFAGPAIGASALHLWPQSANVGAWAVCGLLLAGGAAIAAVRSIGLLPTKK